MFRSACISLLLLATLLSCNASDPCSGDGGTCLSINVQGTISLDAINFTLSGAVQTSAVRSLPAGDTSLPVQVAILLPLVAQGAISISAVATKGEQTVGQGMVTAIVMPGTHLQTTLNLQQVNNTCADGIKDGSETDVDCGGSVCKPCANGQTCGVAMDCQGGACNVGKCLMVSCSDGILDGNETDADCGGPLCAPCANNKKCAQSRDCLSMACTNNACAPAMISLAISPLMPATGPRTGGIAISLAGSGFLNGLKISLGGTTASGVTVVSPIQAQFVLPSAACGRSVDLIVTNLDGSTATAKNAFLYSYCTMLNFSSVTQNLAVGSVPWSVAAGDFNGDGKPDVAVANFNSGKLSVLLNKGDGSGSLLPSQYFATGTNTNSVAVGDFNGDGKPDIVAANYSNHNVSVLLNKGDGSGAFLTAQNFATGTNPESVVVADFNGDGKPDLAVANSNNGGLGSVSILLNNGNGTGTFFLVQNPGAGNDSNGITAGDFNGDGKPDLAVTNYGTFGKNFTDSNVSVLLNKGDGSGSFLSAQNYSAGAGSYSVAAGDFNGDGKVDLAVVNIGTPNNNFIDASMSVLLNKGDGSGSFLSAQSYSAGAYAGSVAVGDFNGDGAPDLAIASYYGKNISVRLNKRDGSGGFLPAQNFVLNDGPHSVIIGDYNGDGLSDLAIAQSGDSVIILLNTSQ